MRKTMTYSEFVELIQNAHIETRFDAICYCMGYFGQISEEVFDMIQKMHYDDKLIRA